MGLDKGDQKQERPGILRYLGKIPGTKEAMIAGSLLASSPMFQGIHLDTAHAAEIAPTDSWEKGAKKIHQEGQKEVNEVFAIFLSAQKTRDYVWGDLTTGIPGQALPDEKALTAYLERTKQQAKDLSEKTRSPIEACVIHTHTLESSEGIVRAFFSDTFSDLIQKNSDILYANQKLPNAFRKDGVISQPPSPGDITLLSDKSVFGTPKSAGYASEISSAGVVLTERHAVFGPDGMWYYQSFRSPEEKATFVADIEKQIPPAKKDAIAIGGVGFAGMTWMVYANSFSANNVANLVADPAYKGLQYAYAQESNGVKLEFVPWNEIKNRQPCSSAMKQ